MIFGQPASLVFPKIEDCTQARKACVNEIFLSIHKYLRASCEAALQGTVNIAGLPEIVAKYDASGAPNWINPTGAVWFSGNTARHPQEEATGTCPVTWNFNASRCSEVYGSSDTVMPVSVNISIAIYLGRQL